MKSKLSNFIDYVKIYCKAGKGGSGSSHLHRSRLTSKGGPDGGDGGRGGNIYVQGNDQMWTLLHLKYTKHIKAGNGGDGSSNNSSGINGKDIYIDVPLGTIARDAESKKFIFEITSHKEKKILRKGGLGGRGNTWFKNSIRQTPRYAQSGILGDEGWNILELKVLADVGLVGYPNSGKSTLLSVLTAAKPKIGDYPFTTLVPNLGIVSYRDNKSFIMADIPGIIKGASNGKGLGFRFLRHIERNSILLFIISSDSNDINKEFKILINELKQYNKELLDKEIILGISKSDLLDRELIQEVENNLSKNINYVFFSSITNSGLMDLKDQIWKKLND
ncbi:MAG: GTPase ObgE [Flavobacteriales bacterium TMED288]|nr:GTPase ObgE [Flavobacteriales bacterium]RPG53465.1 MAG: GTPase ObgE [Flavobacteriales bacterium TMED288]